MRLIDADNLRDRLGVGDNDIEFMDMIDEEPTVHGWRSMVTYGTPKAVGWYLVYAPSYTGGSSTSREHHNGIMFSKWTGKGWSIERCYYNRPGCVVAWMPLPELPRGEEYAAD